MRHTTSLIITALIAFAGVSGTALAQDFRSPDARNGMPQPAGQTLASPDARDSVRHPGPTYGVGDNASANRDDLRSPDARDASKRVFVTYTPGTVVQPGAQVLRLTAGSGFNWGDAGIGAAGMLALVALVAGTLMIATHRRRERGIPIATS